MKEALIVGDLQHDFLPGGALAVADAEELVPLVNALASCFPLVVATLDWHPPEHVSFAANHPGRRVGDAIRAGVEPVLWPVHCVRGSQGAELAPGLDLPESTVFLKKGTDPAVESYSAFFDEARRSTGLAAALARADVGTLYVAGVATDYCVKYTVLDACALGLRTFVILDACRGLDLRSHDVERAIVAMADAGAGFVASGQLLPETPDRQRRDHRHAAVPAPVQ